jgi:hypothetical protein
VPKPAGPRHERALHLVIATPARLLVDCPMWCLCAPRMRADLRHPARPCRFPHRAAALGGALAAGRWGRAVCALRAGVLRVSGGDVAIAAREAVPEERWAIWPETCAPPARARPMPTAGRAPNRPGCTRRRCGN